MTQFVRHIATGKVFVATPILLARADIEVLTGNPFAGAAGPTAAAAEGTGQARNSAKERADAKRLKDAEVAVTAAHGRIETLEREVERITATLGVTQVELIEATARADSAAQALADLRAAVPARRPRAFANADAPIESPASGGPADGAFPFGAMAPDA